jgi:hypothetical protein
MHCLGENSTARGNRCSPVLLSGVAIRAAQSNVCGAVIASLPHGVSPTSREYRLEEIWLRWAAKAI